MATKIHRDGDTLDRLEDAGRGLEEIKELLDFDPNDMNQDMYSLFADLEIVDRYRGLRTRYRKAREALHRAIGQFSDLQDLLEKKADKLMAEG